jgi:hypothetical protein
MMPQKNNIEIKFLLLGLCIILLGSCRLLHLGKEKNGCPTTNNIGAERIMAGDPVALKAAKKANKKNKSSKLFNY